jgi:ribonucleoside-diphosphate reductase alpha chain
MRAQLNFYDGVSSSDIQSALIKSTKDLISEENPNYDKVAARLIMFDLRKCVFGQYEPLKLITMMKNNVKRGFYDKALLDEFTRDEIDELDEHIKHERDNNFRYAGAKQLTGKYLIKDRTTGEIFETPQIMYMLIAMAGYMYDYDGNPMGMASNFDKPKRLAAIKKQYDDLSTFRIGLATPLLAGLRTKTRQYSSCVVMDTADDLDSMGSTNWGIMRYISRKAGLGLNVGRWRPEGSAVKGGELKHTGLLPFIKAMRAAVKSCSQGGVRGGSATINYPLWHYDVEKLLVLKNNKGTEETRERHMDYCVQLNGYLWRRFIKGQAITLFTPQLTDLYEAFYSGDETLFAELYERYEKDDTIKFKKRVESDKLILAMLTESKNTGRIYLSNVDVMNRHTPFYDKIYQTNLCVEIALPTLPFCHIDDEAGRVALCTLANSNWGEYRNPEDMRGPLRRVNRLLDNILTLQDYPMVQARLATEEYRPLGIGVNNLAYFLAKNDVKYSDGSGKEIVHTWMEHMSYYLQESTIDLAQERGACTKRTKRHDGIMVVDTYEKRVDEIAKFGLQLDWDLLRTRAIEHGVRNATLTATMPSESNSQVMNATNGVEPIRSLVTYKDSKDGTLPIVAPGIQKMKNKYEALWDMPGMTGYIELMSIIQKFTDQAISVNFSYNPDQFPERNIPMSTLVHDHLYFFKYGGKNRYYVNTNNTNREISADDAGQELPLAAPIDDDCEACIL